MRWGLLMPSAKVKKPRVPRPYGGGLYTKSALMGFIRSALRAKWLRWKPRGEALRAAQRPLTDEDRAKHGNRIKSVYLCCKCGNRFPQKEVEVDHIVPCGTMKDWPDVGPFAERLFVEVDQLRVVCKPCHLTITQQEKLCAST